MYEQAAIADRAQRALIKSLRRLSGLPGNLLILPHSVLRNLFEEVGWEETLAEEPDVFQDELRLIREALLAQWERLEPRPDQGSLADRLRNLASRLRFLGNAADTLSSERSVGEPAAGDGARAAAHGLESAANDLANGEIEDSVLQECLSSVKGAANALRAA